MKEGHQPADYTRPVAYDAQGRPLYAHPPKTIPGAPAIQAVQIIKPTTPIEHNLTPEIQLRHEDSRRLYPELNLSKGEYVIRVVPRHMIGLIAPIVAGVLLITLFLIMALSVEQINAAQSATQSSEVYSSFTVLMLVLSFFTAVAVGVIAYIYTHNRLFLTNESVIQQMQSSLFSQTEQTVSLANIEDANFSQHGVLQHMFNYGSIRLSTQGDENTYRFTFVADPRKHLATLNNAVEAFKNGRPITGE